MLKYCAHDIYDHPEECCHDLVDISIWQDSKDGETIEMKCRLINMVRPCANLGEAYDCFITIASDYRVGKSLLKSLKFEKFEKFEDI